MSDYADRPLIADSITGLRAFRVDQLGRLTGMTYKEVWRPGINEAVCLRDADNGDYVTSLKRYLSGVGQYPGTVYTTSYSYGGPVISNPSKVTEPLPPKHDVASINCACGFYAVTHGEHHTYAGPHTVTAVVRGTGLVTVGSKGFRAAKAEIVALVTPDCSKPAPIGSKLDRYVEFWRNHEAAAPAACIAAIFAGVAALGASFAVSLLLLPVAIALLPFGVSVAWASFTDRPSARRRSSGNHLTFTFGEGDPLTADQFDKVRRNYAGIPVYPTLAAALRDFPLPERHEPSPEDDDFWTRSAR